MNELTFKDVDSLLGKGELKFYNFYNSDIDVNSYLSSVHYIGNKDDDETVINQKLSVIFLDIEVYHEDRSIKFEFDKSEHPINAITVFNTKTNSYKCFFLIRPIIKGKLNEDVNYYKDYLVDNKYDTSNESLEILLYEDELELIVSCWKYIKESEVCVLSGFNSDYFDYPYIYRRLIKLAKSKNEVHEIISRFKYVEFRNERLKIPDNPICDLLYLYKPRSEGGLSLGSPLASYSLDSVSEIELGMNKIDFKGEITDYAQFYEDNPTDFLLYNIVDVALCKLLDRKLKHIDLQNSSRRIMKIPFSSSMIGSSAFFEGYALYKLSEKNEKIRHGLVTQNNKSISTNDLKTIYLPNTAKRNDLAPINIGVKDYSSIVCKFDGAYVKEPKSQIINGTIIDLDATALYPSKILESNIGFDTYQSRIISPLLYKFLTNLEMYLGQQSVPAQFFTNIYQVINTYVSENKKKIDNQSKFKKEMYFTIAFLLKRIIESNAALKDIYQPKTDEHSYLLMFYLIPLLDALNIIMPNKESYNPFIFDYMFKNENEVKQQYPILYVLNNAGNCNANIVKMNTSECIDFLKQYSFTVCGTCFDKHEKNIGLFSGMLIDLQTLRKSFRAKLKDYDEETDDYGFYNNRQLAVKRIANSSYGVYGLSSFRYSNHWLAQSITSQGKLTLKLSQYLTENYLTQNYESI